MSSKNWFAQQPSHVRLFLGVTVLTSLILFLLLLATLRPTTPWVPADAVATDTLIPPAADSGRHFTPDTLTLLPITSLQTVALPAPGSLRWRVGVAVPDPSPLYFDWPAARPGWYLNWYIERERNAPIPQYAPMIETDLDLGMEFAPMVTMSNGRLFPDVGAIEQAAAANPGQLWLIGNEPDVKWQDNTSPEIYAIAYRRAYQAIKRGDPTAQVAIGGLSEITPLRIDYLDRVWKFYRALYGEEMPVDVWNMHAFVLREERDSWGVNIPPGFEMEQRGMMWRSTITTTYSWSSSRFA
ncbi:MAG: hypothetical protein IPK16_04355 [Anaerolineales bacterium]|nr:hypothetical protein [Anaerolineales bacterium]